MGQTRSVIVYFRQYNDKYNRTKFESIKAQMVCLGLEPGTVGTDESTQLRRPLQIPQIWVTVQLFVAYFLEQKLYSLSRGFVVTTRHTTLSNVSFDDEMTFSFVVASTSFQRRLLFVLKWRFNRLCPIFFDQIIRFEFDVEIKRR